MAASRALPTVQTTGGVVVLAGASAVLGAMAATMPVIAVGAVAAAALASLAHIAPRALLVLGLAAFLWQPHQIWGIPQYVQFEKGLLYAGGLVCLWRLGVVRGRLAPVGAYVVLAVLSVLGGTAVPGVGPVDVVMAFLTLTGGWLVFAVRWDYERDRFLLVVLASMAVVAVVLGAVLEAAGLWEMVNDGSPPRLQGSLIPAWLAATTVAGAAAALVLVRRTGGRLPAALLVANVVVLLATVSRGALIVVALMLVPAIAEVVRRGWRARTVGLTMQAVAVLLAVGGAVATVAPQIQSREDQTIYVEGRGVVKGDASSGRFDAWDFTYQQAEANLVFGRGLGSGPAIGSQFDHFLGQHNEYLRLLLEGGYVGGGLVLLAIFLTIGRVVRSAPRVVRVDLAALALGFAIFSFTDNSLSYMGTAVPVLLVIALGSAPGSAHTAPRGPSRRAVGRRPTMAPSRGGVVARAHGGPGW